ncbi:Uncharacterized conserved protein, DUF1800 family [Rhodoferax sp. OV413]|uniref:DUF1800 domain-containing protein n=1 Tax=Rhodoferax sp. OV413 TaxID=1855285 RepID=UPI000891CB35|nr:DUF1800 domain-containing protein [Rhodoferax sp. OV413]SDP11663.1 Uncharacterized conserved protein, DUF1800 family [Rhodoferax sp. OV413]
MGNPPIRWAPPAIVLSLLLGACANPGPTKPVASSSARPAPVEAYKLTNRLTWGANLAAVDQAESNGLPSYLAQQLHPQPAILPPAVQQQIAAMTISQRPLDQLAPDMEQRNKAANATFDKDEDKKAAQQAYQQEMNRLARESATRHLLRALYSPNQVQEQMTWFWLNHFNVHMYKANLRAMVGDYEDTALRPYALGKFRDLLGAVAHHPAMLRYLDNEQNAANRINENYARELMELHTLGVGAGYTQQDVQEMARILTGVGVNLGSETPKVRKELQADYVRKGLFEFNPNRHDYGAKTLLGQPIKARGLAELDEALDRLARHPATAHFISRKLAQYWLSDTPPPELVERMAQSFLRSDGDIAVTLQTLLSSPEYAQGAGQKFKDPIHYVVSAVRLAYDDKPILNVGPMLTWLNRMGQPLYGRQTPDGYALDTAAWSSPGQMATRFEIAKAIGSGNAGLFKTEGPQPMEQPAFPQLATALYYRAVAQTLGPNTQTALAQATSPQEWNSFLLSSPELMHR